MKIQILTDDQCSWFIKYGCLLQEQLKTRGHQTDYVFNKADLRECDVCFLLSCSRLITQQYLQLSRHNIVVHASDLPAGKGFSPLQWQIVEGRDQIVLTLFEAVEACDAGPYYLKDMVTFDGTELYDELREKMAKKIIDMCLMFVDIEGAIRPMPQYGTETVYPRRTIKDDELDVRKSLAEQFNHLRVADNERHPLFFEYRGCKYTIKIFKSKT